MTSVATAIDLTVDGATHNTNEEQGRPFFQNDSTIRLAHFTVFQTPRPLRRPIMKNLKRFGRFGVRVINPSKSIQDSFSTAVKDLMGGSTMPLFEDEPSTGLAVSIYFRIRRPNNHYVGGRRLVGNIRTDMARIRPTGGDLDNLLKFILDALNGILYTDDKQVIAIKTMKLWADDPTSLGSTTVKIEINE
jgi:Holliday junction resolvase RusA-like endonuclease